MSKNKTNDIEDIFRKAAADYPADFDAKHWQALKEKLDRVPGGVTRIRNGQYKRAGLGLLLLLLLAGGTYWIMFKGTTSEGDNQKTTSETYVTPDEMQQKGQEMESPKEVNDERQASQPDIAAEVAPEVGEVEIDKELQLGTDSIGIKESKKSIGGGHTLNGKPSPPSVVAENAIKTDGSREEKDPKEEIKTKDSGKDGIRFDNRNSMPIKDSSESDSDVVSINDRGQPDDVADAEDSGKAAGPEELEAQDVNHSVEQGLRDETGRTPEQPGQPGQPAEDSDKVVEDLDHERASADSLRSEAERGVPLKNQRKFVERPLLGVSFAVGPDLSVLGLGEITRPGYSYGLVIHYNIGKRWSVGIGALKTTKRYVGTGYDYKPPKGYWEYATNNVVPEKVAGECGLIEIPVDIRFDFLRSGRNNFHISTGASSYLMQHESYEYDFKEPNPNASQGWNSDKAGGSHLFNIINLSVGYERDIGRKFSFGVAPYVKVPVKGIGWTEVKFVSFGTYFTFKYNFLTRRNLRTSSL